MRDRPVSPDGSASAGLGDLGLPPVVDRAEFEAEVERLRAREKAHTRECDAIAAARRRLPMVEVDAMAGLASLDRLLVGRRNGAMHIVCYVRDGDRVFETYWTTGRGVEVVDYSYALMDLTVWGRQEPGEDSPAGWPQHGHAFRTDGGPPAWPRVSAWPGGRPTAQWSRIGAGRSDDLVGS